MRFGWSFCEWLLLNNSVLCADLRVQKPWINTVLNIVVQIKSYQRLMISHFFIFKRRAIYASSYSHLPPFSLRKKYTDEHSINKEPIMLLLFRSEKEWKKNKKKALISLLLIDTSMSVLLNSVSQSHRRASEWTHLPQSHPIHNATKVKSEHVISFIVDERWRDWQVGRTIV